MSTALTTFTKSISHFDNDIDYQKVNFFILCLLLVLVWNLYKNKALLVVFLETDTTRPSYDRRHIIGDQYEKTLTDLSRNIASDTYLATYDQTASHWCLIGMSNNFPSYFDHP